MILHEIWRSVHDGSRESKHRSNSRHADASVLSGTIGSGQVATPHVASGGFLSGAIGSGVLGLGITGKRITWPWWAISSALFGILFLQWHLYASAALQLIFIAAAVMGWFGWEVSGARPGPFANKYRALTLVAIIAATLIFAPILKSIGVLS